MELKINGQEVDLPPDAAFAVTIQSNDITKPDTVQSSYSNSLTLPFTERNHKVLGNANEVTSLTTVPYQKLEADVLQDGVEVMPRPKAYLLQASEGYEVDIFSGTVDLMERLGDKSIRDLDLSHLNHLWDNTQVKAGMNPARTHTSGYVYDLINRGIPLQEANLYPGNLYPSVFVRTVYNQMMLEAGVKWDFENELFDKLLLPFSNQKPVHNRQWIESRTFELSDANSFGSLSYGVVKIKHSFKVNSLSGPFTYFLNINPNGAAFSPNIANLRITQAGEYSLTAEFAITKAYDLTNATINTVFMEGNPQLSDYQWQVSYLEEAVYGSEWSVADNLPDISQKDFFKMVNGLFNLMPSFDAYSDTLRLTLMQELEANKVNALDWSDKLVYNGVIPVQYRFGDFAQKSWLRYKESETLAGDAFFTLGDQQLEEEKDILTLPVAASDVAVNTLHIPVFKESFEQLKSDTGERSVKGLDQLTTLAPQGDGERVRVDNATGVPIYANIERKQIHRGAAYYVRFSGMWLLESQEYTYTPEDAHPRLSIHNGFGAVPVTLREYGIQDTVATIARPSFAGLEFSTLLSTYYPILQGILDKSKGITPSFLLTPQDVQDYDPAIPIWLEQYQSYFYLNSINEYTNTGRRCAGSRRTPRIETWRG
jgi:hypothetical protein